MGTKRPETKNWLEILNGWLGPDPYSTAWVALVPDLNHPERPAWPEALDYIRTHQLDDGGWGEPYIYFAHGRTVATLAAIRALDMWKASPVDTLLVRAGLAALRRYADDLAGEAHQPVGFELVLPCLRKSLPHLEAEFPADKWGPIDEMAARKLKMISQDMDPRSPQAWWVSMEMQPEVWLAQLDESLLDANGAVATAPAATAAYLRARRLAGGDSPRAAAYLDSVVRKGSGSVPFTWPDEVLERVWGMYSLLLAGFDPANRAISHVIRSIHASWHAGEPGLSYTDSFDLNDGDDTLVGYTVLSWAGMAPASDKPALDYWNGECFSTYVDERSVSMSANIHGLSMLRSQPGLPHRDEAVKLTRWLKAHMEPVVVFNDKWQLTPFYSNAHAIPAFAGWDDTLARESIKFILDNQQPDGGWSWFGASTPEETAHSVLGLAYARSSGLLDDLAPLRRAARFFIANARREPVEALWIGKDLFRPAGIVTATMFAADTALRQLGLYRGLIDRAA